MDPPDLCPVADGGEGTLAVLLGSLGGTTEGLEASDPLGRTVRAGFGLLADGGTAIVEVAEASGLGRVAEHERDAEAASSRGTGELIAAAASTGARLILVAAGGSATTDGGMGAIDGDRARRRAGRARPWSCSATCAPPLRRRPSASRHRRAPTRRRFAACRRACGAWPDASRATRAGAR